MGIIIGLTGGIATGKSTISNMFKQKNVKIIDADLISHQVMDKDTPATLEIIKEFGSDIAMATGHINRKKLGKLVFNDKSKMDKLTSIVHPIIIDEIKKMIEIYIVNGDAIVVLDAPLLFESGLDKIVDLTLVVYTTKDIQLERLINRDKISEEYALMKISTQMPLETKIKRADYVIDNSLSILESSKQFNDIFNNILSRGDDHEY